MFVDFREEGRERERNIDQLPPKGALTGDLTHNLGMCPDQELNPQLLVYGMMLQPPRPH